VPTIRIKRILKPFFRSAKARRSPIVDQTRDSLPIAGWRLDDGTFPVILTCNTPYAPLGAANYLDRALADKPVLFVIFFTWSRRKPKAVRELSAAVAAYREGYPQHRFLLLCNEAEEEAAFSAAGQMAIHCNSNAFVDETIFRSITTTERRYESVYNAAIAPFKRHHLASLVPSCAHIFYEKVTDDHEQTMKHLAALRELLPHHHFVNRIVNGHIEPMEPAAVNAILTQCRSGLCLSRREGSMVASMEYLLAGLPVVSTPEVGGRQVFADPEFWLTVPDTAQAVRDGVLELIGRNIPPERIRARTLETIHIHRGRLRDAVARITNGKARLPTRLDDPVYRRSLGDFTWLYSSDLIKKLCLPGS
jgi:hypothetical protein